MGVTIAVAGAIGSRKARQDLLRWIETKAAELEWGRRPIEITFKKGRLRAGAKKTRLEVPIARGVSLLPHFACEALPLVFIEDDGTLVDEILEDVATDSPTFLPGAIVKTQFAGPAVHREISDVLREIRERFAPGLSIDDETGFLPTGDDAALLGAFAEGWNEIRTKVRADRPKPGSRFQIGEFPFEIPSSKAVGEFDAAGDGRDAVLACERVFVTRFGGFGTTLDRSRASVLDLELTISDVDEPGYPKDPGSPEIEALVLQSGAYFGRTIVSVLGGAWKPDDGHLVVSDVGRSGLLVDPFQVARDRILHGPPFSFVHHLEVYETITKNLACEAPR